MTEAERADPANASGNIARWATHFEERRDQEIISTNGLEPVSGRQNLHGRRLWWSGEGRTLPAVLHYIEGGNEPRLEYP